MIGIIGAMDIEVDGLKAKMTDRQTRIISGIEYTSGLLGGQSVVTAVCGVGKVNAAICAQTMILSFPITGIINTGVAGSLTTKLEVGDIAIAADTVEHDMDTTPLGDPLGYITGLNMVRLPSDARLSELLQCSAKALGITHLIGTIVSGDQFIYKAEQKTRLAETFDAIACEMEGAAIGHVCRCNDMPFAIVRAISDSMTGKSEMEYPTFKLLAAEISNKIIMDLMTRI